jgi:glycosidase
VISPRHLAGLALLAAGCAKHEQVFPVRSCDTTVVYAPEAPPGGPVSIAAEWSSFSPLPLQDRGDGTFALTATLEPRAYAYDVVEGSRRFPDPKNPYTRWVGGVEHSRLDVPDCRDPLLTLESFSASGSGDASLRAGYLDGSEAAGPGKVAVTLDGAHATASWDAGARRISFFATGLAPGKHAFRVTATDARGRVATPLYLPFWIEDAPYRWGAGPLYFAMTDRFRDGDSSNDWPVPGVADQANYRGGDFAGLRAAIEDGYFDALGVSAIWISPVDENPDSAYPGQYGQVYAGYHGYWPAQARTPQPRFGSLDDLRALTAAAHARGIRVIADLVVNHLHENHPYYKDHRLDGWFNLSSCVCGDPGCDWDSHALTCWFTPYLPDVSWRSGEATDQLVADALWWVENGDFDGLRVDAVKHVDHVATKTLAARLREIGGRTGVRYWLVGETFTGADGRALVSQYIGPQELDGQFDFPLYWPLVDAFARGNSLKQVDSALRDGESAYPAGAINAPFIGNHDVPRFHSIAANQLEADPGAQAWGNRPPDHTDDDRPYLRARQAFTVLLALPGVPLLYYGDEIGMPGAGDPDNRRMMKFGAQLTAREAGLLQSLQKIGRARRSSRALQLGARATLVAEDDLLVFQREDPEGPDGAIVAIWRGAAPRTLSVSLQGNLAQGPARAFADAAGGADIQVANGRATLSLSPGTAALYLPR